MRFIPAFIILLSITCALHSRAQVIDYAIDTSFNSGLLFNRGSVSDILETDFNTYMIMGMFQGLQSPFQAGAMITTDGDIYNSLTVGGSFVTSYKYDFLRYGNGIGRFNLPGGINFIFEFEFSKSAYSGPLSDRAHDALITPDENILVAGRFFTDSTLMGTAESYLGLRQLCLIDSTGAPVQGFPMLRCAQPVSSEIYTIDKLAGGGYIIAGSFNEVDGHPYAKLAKLNPDFSVDTTFGHVFEPVGFGGHTTLVDSQDRVWVMFAGDSHVLDYPDYPSRIIRLLPNGQIDSSFQAPVCIAYSGGNYENPLFPLNIAANAIEDTDGTFIIYGDFIDVNGSRHKRLAKIYDDGTLIENAMLQTFADSATWPGYVSVFGPMMTTGLRVVKRLPDGKLLVGGEFSSFGGEPYSCLVRLKPNGFVGLEEKEGRAKLKIWPNPSHSYIRISLPIENGKISQVEIVDIQGRQVLRRTMITTNQAIDISNLKAGIYLVKASDGSIFYTQKLMVQ